jgi:membrane-bound serine protease (ClpP class)
VVLQVDSNGAVIGRARMAELLSKIKNSSIPVAVWVGPSGSEATGLSAQLLTVADVSAMAPGTSVGRSGTLLTVDGETVSFGISDDVLMSKTMGFLDAREQKVLKFANDDRGVPVVRNMLLALDGLQVKGKTLDTVVDTLDSKGQVVREATQTRFFKLGLWERLLHTVASPASAMLLLTVGIALLLFELFTAGIGIAGFVGAGALILSCMGLGALPVSTFGLVVFLLAFAAFAVDVQVGIPRFWTGVGLVLYVVSTFTLFESVDGMSLRPSWITLSVCIVSVALTYIVGMPSMTRTRFATPTIGREWLIGAEGEAVGPISPEGTVKVHDATWRARTNRATPLEDRAPLRVVGIDGITLEVEPLEGGARDYREMRGKREAMGESESA